MSEIANIANGYLQLGIAGAALFIVLAYIFISDRRDSKIIANWQEALTKQNNDMILNWQKTLSDMQKEQAKAQVDKLDKLCDKIDELVTATAANTIELSKNLLSNDKDQKNISQKIDSLMEIAIENQRRISRIDDRTYSCLGNPNKKGEDVNVTHN